MAEAERDAGKERIDFGKQIIVFIGSEGSGKSTMAKRLSDKSSLVYISTGDICRDHANNDPSEYGDKCREMFANHSYLEAEVLLAIVAKRIMENDAKNGFILDGGMRTLEETEGFPSMLEKAGRLMPVTVVHLRVPGWMGIQRLVGQNGRHRDDDTNGRVLSRLSEYYKDLNKRATFMSHQPNWRLVHVDAVGNVINTFNNVCGALLTHPKS